MNKSNIDELSAETTADSNSSAQDQQVSQPNANTNVVGSLLGQREIKFRVWDEDNSIMLHDDGREQVDISFYGGKPAVIHHFQEHTIEREGIEMDVPVSNLVTDFILMQYTGLKDKNGKEIYEGDIIEADGSKTILFKDNSDARRFVSPIFKDEYKSYSGRFLFVVYWQSCFSQFSFNPLDPMVSIECNVNKRDFKIIGNIFENPELLQSVA